MHPVLIFVIAVAPVVHSFCPSEKKWDLGGCNFRIHCRGNIRDVSLPNECQGSTNYLVTVDLTLTEAIERFDDRLPETEFLISVISLRVSGNWPTTTLSILEYMPRLKSLYLVDDNIELISGKPFYHLNRLETVDLSHNRLEDIKNLFKFESSPNKMKNLSLAHNHIHEVAEGAFAELTSLIELDLSYNFISNLTEEPFNNLTTLEILKLNNNHIKDLNGAVNKLQFLKHLFLRENDIVKIDVPSLNIIYELETFDISGNHLENLTSVIFLRHWSHFESNSICKMKLSHNQITSIPNATIANREISKRFTRSLRNNFKYQETIDVSTELDLSKNVITNVEYDAFQSVVRLYSLDLSQNQLTDFIVNPRDLDNMKYLNLSTNLIQQLYFESFWSMRNLQNLDLSNNSLSNIPSQTFTNNYNLKYVNMTNNEIKMLKYLRIKIFHPEGGVLDLSYNGLYSLTIPYGEGLRLNTLLLNGNNISNVSLIDLYYQNELKTLDISHNMIQELDENSLLFPISLTSLDLSYNRIQSIAPSSFHRLGHLRTLRLAHNRVSEIEYGAFQGLTSLMNLDLSFNKIVYLDSKVLLDLKSLSFLLLKFNGLHSLEYNGWLGHKFNLKVYLEGNNVSCDWLGKALNDFNNGYSKMRPTVLTPSVTGHSLEGIPCVSKEFERLSLDEESLSVDRVVMADERLLVLTQKILEAITDQNSFMRKYLWGVHQVESGK